MNDAERDVHEALDRLVGSQPPPLDNPRLMAAGRRARRRRSLLAGGAVAGVVAVVVAAVVLPDLGSTGGDTEPARPASSPSGPAEVSVPGLSPEEARRIVGDCVTSYEGSEGPIDTPTDSLQVFNSGRTPWGTSYLIFGPDVRLSCLAPSDGSGYRAHGSVGEQMEWLLGPVVVDRAIADGALNRAPGTYTVEGRVIASVVKVDVSYGSSTLSVPAVNGTFMAAVSVADRELASGRSSFRAYDSTGAVVYAAPKGEPVAKVRQDRLRTCWAAPDGTVIRPALIDSPGQKCKTAVRWR